MPPIPRSSPRPILAAARCLLVAIPDAFEGGQVVQQARAINPTLADHRPRPFRGRDRLHLMKHGASLVVMGEHEIAKAMLDNVAGIATLVRQAAEVAGRAPAAEELAPTC